MISEILREVSVLEDINDATSELVLLWVQRVEYQRVQKEALDNKKEAKDFASEEIHKDVIMIDMGNTHG